MRPFSVVGTAVAHAFHSATVNRSRAARPVLQTLRERQSRTQRIDWRGWLVLAWALWFGGQYARMVVQQRGAKARGIVTGTSKH